MKHGAHHTRHTVRERKFTSSGPEVPASIPPHIYSPASLSDLHYVVRFSLLRRDFYQDKRTCESSEDILLQKSNFKGKRSYHERLKANKR